MSKAYEEWCEIMNQTPNERDRIIFDAGYTFNAIEQKYNEDGTLKSETKPIIATIEKTVYGDCYVQLEANTPHDKLKLNELKEQVFDRGRIMTDFGGGASFDKVLGRQIDYKFGLIVRDKEKPAEPKKKGFRK